MNLPIQWATEVLTNNRDPVDPDIEHIHARLSRLLGRQEPVDSHFDRLSVDPHGMECFRQFASVPIS